jgi:hypothetical protein
MDVPASLMSPVAHGSLGQTSVVIGGLPINIQSANRDFIAMLEHRYAGFVAEPANGGIRLDVEVVAAVGDSDSVDEDLEVRYADGRWTLNRGDFRAQWDPVSMHGSVRQAAYPYAIDSVMRIVHSLVLAEQGGFLVHSASAVRNGRAFLFSGVSGAGKTTISRLAPPDVTLLTDEISYVRRVGDRYEACGTPFAGDWARPGKTSRRRWRGCTCWYKGGTILRAESEGRMRRDGCSVTFCFLPTIRVGSNSCFVRPASSSRGFRFTN